MAQREDGGFAYPKPDALHPNGTHVYGGDGMTYRDWLVGNMVKVFYGARTESGKLADALLDEDDMRVAVSLAHRLADIVIKERNK